MSIFSGSKFLSFVVTVIGLPFAILVFLWDQRRERQNEEEEIYQRLSDEYSGFLKLVLESSISQILQQKGPVVELTREPGGAKVGPFRHSHLALRARLFARLRGEDEQADQATVAELGGLHA